MTKILMKQSMAGYYFAYQPGDVTEIEDELAAAWVASGVAVLVPKEKPAKPVAEYAVAKKSVAAETPEAPKVEAAKTEE